MRPAHERPHGTSHRLRTPWTSRDTAVAVLLVAAAAASWLPRTRGPVDYRWDSAVYYTLGTSIYERHSYRLLNEPGEIRATVFPPLLPLVVAGHQAVLGTSDPVVVGRWLRGTVSVVLAGYFVLAYVLLRTGLTTRAAAFGVLLCTLQWFPHWLSDRCYSDLPFALLATGFFALSRSGISRGAATGLCAVSSYLLRSTGIALMAAWIADALAARDWKSAIVRASIAALPLVAWQGYVAWVEHSPEFRAPAYPYQRAAYNVYNVSYSRLASLRDHRHPHTGFATPGERVTRFFANATLLPVALGGAVSARRDQWELLMERIKSVPRVGRVIPWRTIELVLGALGVLILCGLVAHVRRGSWTIATAVAVNGVLVCVMPRSYMYELPRYLAVFAPALTLALMEGVRIVLATWRAKIARFAVGGLFAIVLTVQTVMLVQLFVYDSRDVTYFDWRGYRFDYRLFTYDAIAHGQDRAISWLNEYAAREAIVVSSSPHWIFLRTGLRAVMPPMVADAGEVRRLLDAVPASYVLVEGPESLGGEYVAPAVRGAPDEWELVVSDPDGQFEMYARRTR